MATPASPGGAGRADATRGPGAGRWLRRGLGAVAIGLLAAALVRVEPWAPWLGGRLEREIERRTGVRVAIGSVAGTWLGRMRIRDVRTVRPGTAGPLVSLEIDELWAGYSPAAALGGGDALLRSARIEVEGARVVLDLGPHPRPGGGGARGGSPGAGPAAAPRSWVLPALRIRALDLTARRTGLAIVAVGISADTRAALPGGRPELGFAAASLTVRSPGVAVGPLPLSGSVREEGGRVEAQFSVPGQGARGTAAYAGGGFEAHLVLDAVALGSGSGPVALPEGTLSGTLSGEVRVRAAPGGGLTGGGELRLEGARLRGVPLERLALEATFDPEALRVGSLDLASGANRVALRGAVVTTEALRARTLPAALRGTAGHVSASLGDVPALLALVGLPLPHAGPPPPHRLDLDGTLGAGTLVLSEGRLVLPSGGVRFERLRATLPLPGEAWSSTRVEAALEIDLPDVALVNRILPLPELAGSLAARVVLDGTPGALRGTLNAAGRALSVAGREVGDLDLAAEAGAGTVLVRTASLAHAGGANRIRVAGLALPAADLAARRWGGLLAGASGGVEADLRDLPALLALAGPAVRRLAFPLAPHRLTLAGRFDAGTLALSAGKLAIAGGTVRLARARVAFPREGRPWGETRLDLDASAELPDLAPLAAPLTPARVAGRLRAAAQVRGTLAEPMGTFSAEVEGGAFGPVELARAHLQGELAADGVRIARLLLEPAAGGSAELAGRIARDGQGGARMEVSALTVRRGDAEARLARPALVRFRPGGAYSVDELRLEGAQGFLALRGVLAPGGDSDLTFSAAGLGTDGWLPGIPGGRVTVRGLAFEGRLAGRASRPTVRLAGSVAALGGAGIPGGLSGRFDLAYEAGELRIAALDLSDAGGLSVTAAGRLPVELLGERRLLPGPLELSAAARVPDLGALAYLFPEGVVPRGAATVDLTLGGSWEHPVGELSASLTNAAVSGIAALEGREPLSARLAAGMSPGRVEIRSLQVASEELAIEAAGSWSGMPPPAELLRRERSPRTGELALRGTFTVPDLAPLRPLLGNPRRLTGRLAGTFSASGPVAAPEVDASLRLEGGAIHYGGGTPAIEGVEVEAQSAGRTVRIVRASGESAGAPVSVSGEVSWGAGGRGLDLAVAGENFLVYRDERATVRADLDLRARGPWSALRLEGTALLQNSAYARTLTLGDLLRRGGGEGQVPGAGRPLFSLREAPGRDLELDIRVGTGSPVAIRTNVARGAVRPELTLTGTGLLPVLSGDVFIDPTRVMLPGGTLLFERGLVTFPAPGAGEARIDLAGRARLLGYDVTVLVAGDLRAPEVTLSSVPPLPDEELLLLVLAGTPPATGDAAASKRVLEASLARFLTESLLDAVAEGGGAASDLAERIEVEIGRNVSRTGEATIETRLRLLGGTAPTGRTLYLAGGTDVYDAYTMGVTLVFRFR